MKSWRIWANWNPLRFFWHLKIYLILVNDDIFFFRRRIWREWLHKKKIIFEIIFLKNGFVSGYTLRYDEHHNYDNGFNQNMHHTDVQREIFKPDRVHATKFLERWLRLPGKRNFGRLQENVHFFHLLRDHDWNVHRDVLSDDTCH